MFEGKSLAEIIAELELEPLEGEGGYFKVIQRDDFGNAIYFLMSESDFSAWHILKERETWVHLAGDPVLLHLKNDSYRKVDLSRKPMELTYSIEPNTWMAAKTTGQWSLVLCFLAPAFTAMELATPELVRSWREKDPTIPELIHER
jgi:predicted cupin superfamily sugar epimerase